MSIEGEKLFADNRPAKEELEIVCQLFVFYLSDFSTLFIVSSAYLGDKLEVRDKRFDLHYSSPIGIPSPRISVYPALNFPFNSTIAATPILDG